MSLRASLSVRTSRFSQVIVLLQTVDGFGRVAKRPTHILLALARFRSGLDCGRLELFLASVRNETSPMNSTRLQSFLDRELHSLLLISLAALIGAQLGTRR